MKKKKANYETQNKKLWTVNFSAMKHVQRAKIIVPSLMKRAGLWSRGVTILLAIEYCQQEAVYNDFINYVNSRRRALKG